MAARPVHKIVRICRRACGGVAGGLLASGLLVALRTTLTEAASLRAAGACRWASRLGRLTTMM